MKFITSRIFYLVIGIVLALGFYAAQAAWNSVPTTGSILTVGMWQDIVNKLTDLDQNKENKVTCPCGTCWASRQNGNYNSTSGYALVFANIELCTPAGWIFTGNKDISTSGGA